MSRQAASDHEPSQDTAPDQGCYAPCQNSLGHCHQLDGAELPEDWVVLHSLGVHGHSTKIWGETDILVLSSRGFSALEVSVLNSH